MPKARSMPRRSTLGDGSDNPTYIFTEPRVGYRMPRGETWEGETEWLSPRGCASSRAGITLCEAAMAGLVFTVTLRESVSRTPLMSPEAHGAYLGQP